jgi:phosphopantothenoylcysteine decarboxylase/phosphopantothenate--cysteine ligase
MSAAVADYTVSHPANEKIKKNESELTITLEKTTDILKSLGETKKDNQVLVGFALETNHEKENALQKLHLKKADMIILNSLNDAGAGFGYDTNKISIFDKKGNEFLFELKSKQETASDIVNAIYKYSNG